jgi:hypothetical protein
MTSEHPSNLRSLAESSPPSRFVERDEQIKWLAWCLSPIVKRSRPFHPWIDRPAGTGKTSMTRFALESLRNKRRLVPWPRPDQHLWRADWLCGRLPDFSEFGDPLIDNPGCLRALVADRWSAASQTGCLAIQRRP